MDGESQDMFASQDSAEESDDMEMTGFHEEFDEDLSKKLKVSSYRVERCALWL